MSLESGIRLMMLMAPYILKSQALWPQIQANLEGGQPTLASLLLRDLGAKMAYLPGDIVTAYSLLLDRPQEWIAVNGSAKELIEILPELDRVNGGFKALWEVCCNLGIVTE